MELHHLLTCHSWLAKYFYKNRDISKHCYCRLFHFCFTCSLASIGCICIVALSLQEVLFWARNTYAVQVCVPVCAWENHVKVMRKLLRNVCIGSDL